ncbi:MAG TPA: molybdate ABC transporter substrate-binding protein [Candidatus Eisenbacteria bacterium]|nr:molybdate ABC transporter substrate-binding protein [Candidatus Eisenbacteria bacterium]
MIARAALCAAALLSAAAAAPARAPSPARAPGARTVTLQVLAAASLAGAFGELAPAFERAHAGVRVRSSFGGSQQLASQLAQGAIADVFASADERCMRDVAGHGLLMGPAQTFARNRLAVIVPDANPGHIRRLQDLARPGVALVLAADAVPVGRYGRAMLRNLSADPAFGRDFDARVLRNVVSEEQDVLAVVGKVQLGEADAGIVYASDVTPAVAGHVRAVAIPAAANVIARYPIAVLRGAPASDAARAFVAFVRSPEGQRILARHGLTGAAPGAP